MLARYWALPSADTFDCKPIGELVRKYLRQSKVSIDPFARNKRWCTYTNDINPNTTAEHHLMANDFLQLMVNRKIKADVIIFDPPYSPEQVKRSYDSFGLKMTQKDGQRSFSWTEEKRLINRLLITGGYFLHFGWNTIGMGKERGYEIVELFTVCHGAGHPDTLCMVERKLSLGTDLVELFENETAS